MMVAEAGQKNTFDYSALPEAVSCGLIFLGRDLNVLSFNEAAQSFFTDVCILRTGMSFDTLSGTLRDIADEKSSGEAVLVTEQIYAFEECTVDYQRFDGKFFRISVKPVAHPEVAMSLQITDISDIAEAEQLMAKRGMELDNERSTLMSRLKLVDAIVSEREAERLRAEYFVRMARLLDRFEATLDSGDLGACRAEIKRQREYIKPQTQNRQRENFAERLKKSVCPGGADSTPRVVFHHIAHPKCLDLLENDIIDAARECVILVAVCSVAQVAGISLRSYEDGVELSVHCDNPIVPDFEAAEPFLRLKKIAKKIHAELSTNTSSGFDLSLRCVYPVKEAVTARYKLTEIEQDIIRMTGQGMSSAKIAAQLHYSQGSLRNMLSAIYDKLGISDKAQLTAFAILNGFSDSFTG